MPPAAKTRRTRRSPRLLLAAIILVVPLGLAGWLVADRFTTTAAALTTIEVTRGDLEDTVTALGNLQPLAYVDVGTQVSGQLKAIHVEIGDQVKAGDLLAELDPKLYLARVEADQAQLLAQKAQQVDREAQRDLAALQLARQRRLTKARATSADALEVAEAAARSAAAQVEVLKAEMQQTESTLKGDQANLEYTKIYAPMAGTIVSLTARQGQTLNANQQAPIILRIADLSVMTVTTQVSEADVSRLALGMTAYFTTLGSGETRWTGTLRQILPTPEVVNNVVLYNALFDVDNKDGRLMTQMTAQVFFVVAEARNAVLVPTLALRRQPDGSHRLMVLGADGLGHPRAVTIGVSNRVSTEIVSGLDPGETVVLGRAGPASGGVQRTGGQRPGRPAGFGGL